MWDVCHGGHQDRYTSEAGRQIAPAQEPVLAVGVSGGRGGLSLGYRKTGKGNGVWVAKVVIEGRRLEERIGVF